MVLVKATGLSRDEVLLARMTALVIRDLLLDVMLRHSPPDYERASSRRKSKKHTGRVSLLYKSVMSQMQSPMHPEDIRKLLPAGIKSIHAGDLTNILKTPLRVGTLTHETRNTKNPRGRPSRLSESRRDAGGRPSLYRASEVMNKVDKLLTKPEALRIIDSYLMETGVLQEYLEYSYLLYFAQVRNHDASLDTDDEIFGAPSKKREQLEQEYAIIRSWTEEELEPKAAQMTKDRLANYDYSQYQYIKRRGAVLALKILREQGRL